MILSVECRQIRFYCALIGNSQVYGQRHNRIICYIKVNEDNQLNVQYGHLCLDCMRNLSRRSYRMPPISARTGVTLENIITRMATRLSQTHALSGRYNNFKYTIFEG